SSAQVALTFGAALAFPYGAVRVPRGDNLPLRGQGCQRSPGRSWRLCVEYLHTPRTADSHGAKPHSAADSLRAKPASRIQTNFQRENCRIKERHYMESIFVR